MTSTERFVRCMHYEPIDHVVDMEFGYWEENHINWQNEGLPPGLDIHEGVKSHYGLENHYLPTQSMLTQMYFGLERRYWPPVNVLLEPGFKVEEIMIRDGYRYYYDEDRVMCRVPDDGKTTMPEHLEYS